MTYPVFQDSSVETCCNTSYIYIFHITVAIW